MEKVVNFVRQDEEEIKYIAYWLKRLVIERLAEVTHLKHNYYSWLNHSFPDKIETVVNRRHL